MRRLATASLLPLALALSVASCDAPTPPAPAEEPADPPEVAASNPTDSAALAALYHATDGDNWKRNDNWLSGADLSDWWGVSTDTAGRVTWLSLVANDLDGSLPAALGDLDRLEWLWLSNNSLSSIPAELGSLDRLEWLGLYDNDLSSVPPELGDLSNLKRLSLGHNELDDPDSSIIDTIDDMADDPEGHHLLRNTRPSCRSETSM